MIEVIVIVVCAVVIVVCIWDIHNSIYGDG